MSHSRLFFLAMALIVTAPCPSQTMPLHRYYNADPAVVDHFYTSRFSEIGCGANGWLYEGTIGSLASVGGPSRLPLHRYWSPSIGDHFYTTDPNETEASMGYIYEGIVGYVSTTAGSGLMPLYRWWSGDPAIADHLYTTSPNELPVGYRFEGIIGYVWPATVQMQCRPVLKSINYNDRCSVPIRTVIWTNNQSQGGVFSDGSRLELTCEPTTLSGDLLPHPTYMLWYQRRSGQRLRIAQCLFGEGENGGSYLVAPDGDGDGKPDTLIWAEWENIDGGENDGLRAAVGFVFTTPAEPYLDVLRYHYDAIRRKLSWQNDKYTYPSGTTELDRDKVYSYVFGQRRSPVPGKGIIVDPEVGSTTETLFDAMLVALQPDAKGPMGVRPACDLNADGRCDATDAQVMALTVGTCAANSQYSPLADIDRDGCVTELDREAWAESQHVLTSGCVNGVGYWRNHQSVWPVAALTLGSDVYTKDQLVVMLQQPIQGSHTMILRKQLIAAKLNYHMGSLAPNGLIALADAMLAQTTSSVENLTALARLLAEFNEGATVVRSCGTAM